MIHFEKVTPNNFEAVINLRLREDQIGFLENNLYSLAEATVFDYLEPRAVYDDDKLIGFESTGEVRRTIRPGTSDEYDEELVRRKYY